MPKNVMKMLKPHPTHGRNDFDLSHRNVFAANFGELIPSMCVETVPGDKIKVRISDLVRAQPMVTSPFLRAKQHVDVWFVPYNLMWSRFNEFMSDKDEPASSALKDRLFVPHAYIRQLQTAISQYEDYTFSDIHGDVCDRKIARNLDLLGYGGSICELFSAADVGEPNIPDLAFNLWRIAAYNLIWYREYRQQYYDDGKYNLPPAVKALSNGASYLFNFDWLQCDSEGNADLGNLSIGTLCAMIQPRYRCWKKDIYTGLMPSTQFGNVSVIDNNQYVDLLTNSSTMPGNYLAVGSTGLVGGKGTALPTSQGQFNTTFDILQLRKSEAIQRWRENALRAGNQIEDNFEAHYGVKPKSHLNCHPDFVASFDAPLNIGDVNAQASTGESINGFLGDVAGKGIMSFGGDDEFTFETNDFGVLMAIYSVLPEAEYNANNLDRMNALLERDDYFVPENENVGLEGVARSVISLNTAIIPDHVIGYGPRYFGYKQKHDRCCGEFMYFNKSGSSPLVTFNGQYRHWCSPKVDVDTYSDEEGAYLSTLYVNPSVFDVNFNVAQKDVDQFLVDMYNNVEAIRCMSVSGLPSY